jgi:parvulin-like peptidyl-prolyl isomerase
MEALELVKAIKYLKPNSEFVFKEADYSTIEWVVLDGAAPTWEEVQAAHLQVKAAEEAALAEAEAKKQALLDRLGITAEEAKLLLS